MTAAREINPTDLIGEALRVLKRLAAPGARLIRRGDVYALVGTGRAGRAMHVPEPTVHALRRRDWLTPETREDAYVLSNTGLGWLKRTLDGEDPFAAQHRVMAHAETTRDDGSIAAVAVNEAESPIALLRAQMDMQGKPLIDDAQFSAGERLRRDFTLANLEPRLTVDLTATVVAGRRGANHDELSDIAVAARQRFSRAVSALGPGLSDVAVGVCCHLKEPHAAESAQDWPHSAAVVVLKLALDRLALHYGFAVTGKRSRIRTWQAPEESDAADETAAV